MASITWTKVSDPPPNQGGKLRAGGWKKTTVPVTFILPAGQGGLIVNIAVEVPIQVEHPRPRLIHEHEASDAVHRAMGEAMADASRHLGDLHSQIADRVHSRMKKVMDRLIPGSRVNRAGTRHHRR